MTVYSRGERLFGLIKEKPRKAPIEKEIVLYDYLKDTEEDMYEEKEAFTVLNQHQISLDEMDEYGHVPARVLTGPEINAERLATPFNWRGTRTTYYWQDDHDIS